MTPSVIFVYGKVPLQKQSAFFFFFFFAFNSSSMRAWFSTVRPGTSEEITNPHFRRFHLSCLISKGKKTVFKPSQLLIRNIRM